MDLTAKQLRSIMPRVSGERSGRVLPFLKAAMAEFAIDVPARAAAFLAQLAHESGELRFMEEIWGPTDAQRRYEPVTKLSRALGNAEAGDGRLFKGRGPIQLTGRANYRRFGDLLGVDLVADPPRAATPDVAFRIAGLFWSRNGLNELADLATADAFTQITRRINGGTNGLAERQKFYAVARQVLDVRDVPPVTRGPAPDASAQPASDPPIERGAEAIRAYAPRRRAHARRKVRKPRPKPRRKRNPKRRGTKR